MSVLKGRGLLAALLLLLAALASAALLRFAFRVYADSARSVPVAAASEPAVRVNGSHPLIRQAPIRLTGKLLGFPASASSPVVTVRVGGKTHSATVQGDTYSVSLAAAPTETVQIDARSGATHFNSFVGSIALLRARSGNDGEVNAAEHSSLNVSPYSTALALLVRKALGERNANDDPEFEQATRAVVGQDLAVAAYSLSLLAQQGSLPAGYSTGLQLLDNEAAYRQFRADTELETSAMVYLYEQPDHAPLKSVAELADEMVFMSPIAVQEMPLVVSDTMLLMRRPSGQYDLHENIALTNTGLDGVVDPQGRLSMESLEWQTRFYQDNQGRWVDRRPLERSFRRLSHGSSYGLWVIKTRWLDKLVFETAEESFLVDYKFVWAGALREMSRADGWPALTGPTWALPWMCMRPDGLLGSVQLKECQYVEHDLNSMYQSVTVNHGDKVGPQLQPQPAFGGEVFTWSRDGQGVLNIVNNEAQTTFWRLKGAYNGIGPVIYLSKATAGEGAGQSLAGFSVAMLNSSPEGGLQAQHAIGAWETGHLLALPPSYPNTRPTSLIERLADGLGTATVTEFDRPSVSVPFLWQVRDQAIYDTRYLARFPSANRYVRGCGDPAAAGASSCSATQVRYYKPLAKSWDRYYGIEEIYLAGSDPQAPLRSSSRPFIQACRTGGACSVNFVYPTRLPAAMEVPVPVAVAPTPAPVAKPQRVQARTATRLRGLILR